MALLKNEGGILPLKEGTRILVSGPNADNLRGQNGATVARVYWSNKATAIVSDVPSEAALAPQNWGVIEMK